MYFVYIHVSVLYYNICVNTGNVHIVRTKILLAKTKGAYIFMKRIMITGALGQIGTELVGKCREIYGTDNVLATDIREPEADSPVKDGPLKF